MSKKNDVRPIAVLARTLGKADEGLRAAFLSGTSDEELIVVGKQIASSRVLTDGSRIYWQAWEFLEQASPEQKKRLRGLSLPLLTLAVEQLCELEELEAQHQRKAGSAEVGRALRGQAEEKACAEGAVLRDQAYDAMRSAAAHDKARLVELEAAKGSIKDGKALSQGLASLGVLLKAWLKEATEDAGLKGRLQLANLDTGYARDLAEMSTRVGSAAEAALQRDAGGKVTQGKLDRADGLNILLLKQVVRAFESAHALDATIPRLLPIATRRLFSRKKKGVAVVEAPVIEEAEKSAA